MATPTTTTLQPLDPSKLSITRNPSPGPVPPPETFSQFAYSLCTDHMITARWTSSTGWAAPALVPYGPLPLYPTSSVLHYATSVFEGMKVYRGTDNQLRLFRPSLNGARMSRSASRMSLPSFSPSAFVSLVAALAATDCPRWLPDHGNLYIRPVMIADDPVISVRKPSSALLCIMMCIAPLTNPSTRPPLKLLASASAAAVRAWPGGTGSTKSGVNYGPGLAALADAVGEGYNYVLWLFDRAGEGRELVTEAGSSNIFVVWRRPDDDKVELVTPEATDGLILEGVTRRSVLDLCTSPSSELGEILDGGVRETSLEIAEIARAADEGRLLEVFTCGTAVFVWNVCEILWKGRKIIMNIDEKSGRKVGDELRRRFQGIVFGEETHEWGYVVREE